VAVDGVERVPVVETVREDDDVTESGDLIADRYHLLERLGGGAMGVVWHAHDTVLARDVAVKELLAHGGMTAAQAQEANLRARREARIAARLHHPHAIGVYDVVEHAGRPCLIMEFLPARSLADLIAEHGSPRTSSPPSVPRSRGRSPPRTPPGSCTVT
jgi:serine/threonine protein kinase